MGQSLNPCCNGRGSKTRGQRPASVQQIVVLILVVMEEGQRRTKLYLIAKGIANVLILVVMEEGQRLELTEGVQKKFTLS